MAKIIWTKDMSIGNKILDKQHKDIIEHFNNINELLSSSKGVELGQVRETMHFTNEYIKNHFEYEEARMKRAKFPGFKGHVKIHKALIRIFDAFAEDFHKLYTKKYISSPELSELLSRFERDVAKKYVKYMVKELEHLRKYKYRL